MKLNKFCIFIFKTTLKIMKKIPGNLLKKPGKIVEISWNFVSPKKWEPCYGNTILQFDANVHASVNEAFRLERNL